MTNDTAQALVIQTQGLTKTFKAVAALWRFEREEF